jgi:hypothetical protein
LTRIPARESSRILEWTTVSAGNSPELAGRRRKKDLYLAVVVGREAPRSEVRREWGRPLRLRRDPSKRSRAPAPALPSTLSFGVVQSLSHRRSCRRQEESCPSPPSSDSFVVVAVVTKRYSWFARRTERSFAVPVFFLAGGGAHAGCEAGRRRWPAAAMNPRARYPTAEPNPKDRSSGLSLILGPAAAPWWRAMIEAPASAPAAVEPARARQKGPTGKHSERAVRRRRTLRGLSRAPRSRAGPAVKLPCSAVDDADRGQEEEEGRTGPRSAADAGTAGTGRSLSWTGRQQERFSAPLSRGVFLARRRNRGGRERMK